MGRKALLHRRGNTSISSDLLRRHLHHPSFRFLILSLTCGSIMSGLFRNCLPCVGSPNVDPTPGPAGPSGSSSAGAANIPAQPSYRRPMIQKVWASNLKKEMIKIQEIAQSYNYISLDTQHPGILPYLPNIFSVLPEFSYKMMKYNVKIQNIIQLGLTFMNADGEFPPGVRTWQFNFEYDLQKEKYHQGTISALKMCGIKFDKHKTKGIPFNLFAEVFKNSGLVRSGSVKWISFQSFYDFGYMVKLLADCDFPETAERFLEVILELFPTVYDIKYFMDKSGLLKGGLQHLVIQLRLERIGRQYHAGSESMLAGMAFFKLKEMFPENQIDDQKYAGKLHNLVQILAAPQRARARENAGNNE